MQDQQINQWTKMEFLKKYKPGIDKRTLLLVAGCAWTIAGGILISRALLELYSIAHHLWLEILIGIILGTVFYMLLFSRISKKHINRILLLPVDDPCFFSFFNLRSYFMMTIMIAGGITLRKLDVINHEILYTFYLTMGIPLLVSAFRFFFNWRKNKTTK
jgi:hypothetical protein